MFFLHSKLPGGAVILSALTSPGIIIFIACQVCKLLLLTWQSKKDTSQICIYMVWSCRPGIFNKKDSDLEMMLDATPLCFCIWLKCLFKQNEQDPIKYLTFSFLPLPYIFILVISNKNFESNSSFLVSKIYINILDMITLEPLKFIKKFHY